MTTQQVNDTIISLLEAKGYHPSVSRAFCMGLEKTGRFTEVREIVCGLYKKRIFYPRSQSDLDNPDRLFQTRRRVIKRERKAKFYPPYIMDKREVLLFSARYPEVEVIYKAAKHDNKHAFHANCRHVSTEILLGYVREHAAVHELDANSVVDVGGNEAYHMSRGRGFHCDTPMLSARDRARYLHREVYSGSKPSARCTLKFQDCKHSADFAIAVHSTYDMTPFDLAVGMARRGIKAFYGVLVIPTNLEYLYDGSYSCDGTDITVKGDMVSFDFPYDASARYTHSRTALLAYLKTRGTIKLADSNNYAYRVISLRGDTLFFSILPIDKDERVHGLPMSVVPPQAKYYIYVPVLSKQPLEVDAQPFDRIVFTAASARNFQSYDIVSLYQYAKSLRQALVINNVPLSHGYGSTPAEVVVMVVAAYCIAASFRAESSEFFKQVTRQINSVRDSGFLMNLFNVVSGSFCSILKSVVGASGIHSLFGVMDSAVYAAAMSTDHVSVSVSPIPFKQGLVIDTAAPPVRVVDTNAVAQIPPKDTIVPPTARMGINVSAFERYRFISLKVPGLGTRMYATSGCHDQGYYTDGQAIPEQLKPVSSVPLDLKPLLAYDGTLDAYSTSCNDATRNFVVSNSSKFKQIQPVMISKNGDHVHTQLTGRKRHSLIIRGLGCNMVVLRPPSAYAKATLTFALRYDFDITDALDAVISDEQFSGDPNALKLARYLARGRIREEESTLVASSQPSGSDRLASGRSSPSVAPTVRTITTLDPEERFDLGQVGLDSPESSDDDVAQSAVRVFPSAMAPAIGDESTPSEGGSDSVGVPVVMPNLPAGYNALGELSYMNEEFVKATITMCQSYEELAKAVDTEPAARARWRALSAALPAEPTLVQNRGNKLYDVMESEVVKYGGVCWKGGLVPTDFFLQNSYDGEYAITTNDLVVFVVIGLETAIKKYGGVHHDCEVMLEDAPAGNGKTYYITTHATVNDYVVSETRAACDELRNKLLKRDAAFSKRCFTADSVIVNDRVVDSVAVLYIDEALRLHAGKIYLLIRMLRPERVLCFGDSKQIPSINFMPGYDFVYNKFPFSSVRVLSTSRTMIPSVAMALSQAQYYDRKVVTYSSELDSQPVSVHLSDDNLSVIAAERPDTVVLTYTRVAKSDYRKMGIPNVYTIGDVQGQRFDHVILVRERDINKVLYFDLNQTLTAVTRARKSVIYVTASIVDESAASKLVRYINSRFADTRSHFVGG